jgi:hypothetical protein
MAAIGWGTVSTLYIPEVVPHWNETLSEGDVPTAVKVPFKVAELAVTAVAPLVVTEGGTLEVRKLISAP